MTDAKFKTENRNKIRSIMAIKGLNARDLAKQTGLSYPYVRHLICGSFTHGKGRRKLESALHHPIWTPAKEFYEQVSAHKEK